MIERSTYSSLEWLGDIGGLYDALLFIGKVVVSPIALLSLKAELVTRAFGDRLSSFKEVAPQ